MDHPNLVVVHSYGTRAEAELAISELDSADVPATIQSDSVGGMREHLAWSGFGFQILVREEDLATAREILNPRASPTE